MPPPTPDPFDLLNLPPRFDLDPAALRHAYLTRSAALHPDHASAPDPDAEHRAAELNLARQTLENPESRAEALLARLGGPSSAQDRSLPPGFLADMLATREEIEAALASNDPAQIEIWETWAESRRAQHIATVRALFNALPQPPIPPTPAHLAPIRAELNMWRYIERLLEQLDPDAPQA